MAWQKCETSLRAEKQHKLVEAILARDTTPKTLASLGKNVALILESVLELDRAQHQLNSADERFSHAFARVYDDGPTMLLKLYLIALGSDEKTTDIEVS